MNLDELISKIKELPDDDSVNDLLFILKDFKKNNKTVLELEHIIETFIDSYWPKKGKGIKIVNLLNKFKNTTIKNITGMTMNERLFLFCLFDRFDTCKTESKKELIYKKLLANKHLTKKPVENIEKLIILGRAGLKYIDESGIEYFIDSEMIIHKKYDFVLFSDTIKLFEDYLKEENSENKINTTNITKAKQKRILKRVNELWGGKILIE